MTIVAVSKMVQRMCSYSTSHAHPHTTCLVEEVGKVEQRSILTLQPINHRANIKLLPFGPWDFGCSICLDICLDCFSEKITSYENIVFIACSKSISGL